MLKKTVMTTYFSFWIKYNEQDEENLSQSLTKPTWFTTDDPRGAISAILGQVVQWHGQIRHQWWDVTFVCDGEEVLGELDFWLWRAVCNMSPDMNGVKCYLRNVKN